MNEKNNLFGKLANDILARSQITSNQNSDGLGLYTSFCNLFFSKHKLTRIDQKLITVFYKGNRNIFSIEIQTAAIKITLNAKYGALKDDRNLFRDVSKIGHWGSGDYQVKLSTNEHFDYVIELVKQIE